METDILKKQHQLESYLLENPASPLFAWYARQNMEIGKLDRAKSICLLGVKGGAHPPIFYKLLGDICLTQGETKEAKGYYEKCLDYNEPYKGVIELYLKLWHNEIPQKKADALFEKLFILSPNSAKALKEKLLFPTEIPPEKTIDDDSVEEQKLETSNADVADEAIEPTDITIEDENEPSNGDKILDIIVDKNEEEKVSAEILIDTPEEISTDIDIADELEQESQTPEIVEDSDTEAETTLSETATILDEEIIEKAFPLDENNSSENEIENKDAHIIDTFGASTPPDPAFVLDAIINEQGTNDDDDIQPVDPTLDEIPPDFKAGFNGNYEPSAGDDDSMGANPETSHQITESMATFTLMQIFKDQGLYEQALKVLELLRESSTNTERIEKEAEEIKQLILDKQSSENK